jgi:hypothetical protein
VRCFYYRKEGHVRNDCLVWKKIIQEGNNSKSKVGVNVAMVDWDQLVVNVCVTTRGQKVKMLEVDMHVEELLKKQFNPTKGH